MAFARGWVLALRLGVNIIYYTVGVAIIFLAKLLVNNKNDEPTDKWKRIFEVPADITMLSFMMGIAGTASVEGYDRNNQVILLIIVGLSIVSISIFKQNCRTVSAKGGITQFDGPKAAIGWFALNVAVSVGAAILSYSYLGANES